MAEVTAKGRVRWVYPFKFSQRHYGEVVAAVENRKMRSGGAFWQSMAGDDREPSPPKCWHLNKELIAGAEGFHRNEVVWSFRRDKESPVELTLSSKAKESVLLTLSEHGVGLLSIELSPKEGTSHKDWVSFLSLAAHCRYGDSGFQVHYEEEPECINGGNPLPLFHEPETAQPLPALLLHNLWPESSHVEAIEAGPKPRIYPYFSLVVEGLEVGEQATLRSSLLCSRQWPKKDEADVLGPEAPGLKKLQENAWFLATGRSHGVLVFDPGSNQHLKATVPSKFFSEQWAHYRSFQLQSLILAGLKHEVADYAGKLAGRGQVELFQDLERQFIQFLASAYQPELRLESRREQLFCDLLEEQFRLDRRFDLVREAIQLTVSFVSQEHERKLLAAQESAKMRMERFERHVTIGGLAIAMSGLWLGYFGVNLEWRFLDPVTMAVFILFGGVVIAGTFSLLGHWIIKKTSN